MPLDQTRPAFPSPAAAATPEARLYLREEELDRAVDLVLGAARAFFRSAEGPLDSLGLGPAHYRALAAIRRHGDSSITALLERLGVRKQSLARVLGELEAAGLIVRAKSPADRRARVVRLTEAGAQVENTVTSALRERLARVFREAGAEAVAGARTVLAALSREEPAP